MLFRKKTPEDMTRKKLLYMLSLLDRKLVSKVKRIPRNEQIEALHYSIISELKHKHFDLEREFEKKRRHLKKSHSGVDYLGHQISLLPSKIAYFETDFERQEFKKILHLIRVIEKEVSHV